MKKVFGISLIAILSVLPLIASAEGGNPTAATTSSEPFLGKEITDADGTKISSVAYVKGAYNAAIGAINAVATTANGAVQSVTEGSTNGTISVDNTDVSVHGLGSAAYTDSTAYATAAQGTTADNAVQTVKVNGSVLTEDANHDVNLTVATGSTAGTIAVNGTDIAVNGVVTDLSNYATKQNVTDSIDAATGSVNNVSLGVSGSVTGTVSGTVVVPIGLTWGDDLSDNTISVALTNGTLNNGTIANGATATGNITGIDIAAASASASNTVTCPYVVPAGASMPASPDDIGGCDSILNDCEAYSWSDNQWNYGGIIPHCNSTGGGVR